MAACIKVTEGQMPQPGMCEAPPVTVKPHAVTAAADHRIPSNDARELYTPLTASQKCTRNASQHVHQAPCIRNYDTCLPVAAAHAIGPTSGPVLGHSRLTWSPRPYDKYLHLHLLTATMANLS
jgi:hypothetical protein